MAEPGSHALRFDLRRLAALGTRVERLSNDSRRVAAGDVFVAYPGSRGDGRDYIAQAIAAGAAGVLWEAEGYTWPAHWRTPNLGISGLREVAGEIAAAIAGHPASALWMIGVTGTNGNTSCSQ